MRAPNRLVPFLGRWGGILLAVFLVYYIIRAPISLAVSSSNLNDAAKESKQKSPAANPNGGLNSNGPAHGPEEEPKYVKKFKGHSPRPKPVDDHFPWLTYNGHKSKGAPIPPNNRPPLPHVDESTPLLVGFTHNWPMLLQCVSSYIAAGWPPGDIYVVENTGVFSANQRGDLSLQNQFFLNHTALHQLGVNVLIAPTLLSFAQLQNFFLHTALQRDWRNFFWTHQDVIVFSDEDVRRKDRDHDWDHDPFATMYERSIGLMRYLNGPEMPPWSTHFFSYDHFTLVNRDAYLEVGAWDTHIPFFATDCDMYLRLHWAGYWQPQSESGLVFDVNRPLKDIGALFRIPGAHARFEDDPVFAGHDQKRPHREAELKREEDMYSWVDKEGETYTHLIEVAGRMQELKWADTETAGSVWKEHQYGGEGEPFYRNPEGFKSGIEITADAGRSVFAEKWGHRGCDLLELGIEGKDMWKLERDWDITKSPGSVGGSWGKDWSKEF
ncbi:hypothetical protein GGR57DRAFT_350620 [Xylariaceae sp. FL1272]|nr:hypothetical protein GGR57DRAFT_350620 [Xylariaceae sp. FL1272]